MFQVKICGITSPEDALLAAEAGADAIGLNFYEQSPRYVTPERAKGITQGLYDRKWKGRAVGVFVNASREVLFHTTANAETNAFQLHGDEAPEVVQECRLVCDVIARGGPRRLPWWLRWVPPGTRPSTFHVIRAFHCRDNSWNSVSGYLESCQAINGLPHAVLLDAYQPGAYGGTGQVVDWNVVREERDLLMGLPVILAGGLTPENVAEAIATARPDAVDVASGVESAPGKKDPAKVQRFVAEAKRAFAALAGTKS